MKLYAVCIFAISSLVAVAGPEHAHGGNRHSHAHGDGRSHSHAGEICQAGPNGGRVIHSVEPHVEFFVNAERKVQITFLDEEGNVVAPSGQVVSVVTGSRAQPLRLSFSQVEEVLLSDAALPAGNNLPVVLQIRAAGAGTVPVIERFMANLAQCPTCAYAEYACVCAGHG